MAFQVGAPLPAEAGLFDCGNDLPGNLRLVHSINMDAVHMMGLQVKNLFYCVIDTGFPHFRRIVSIGGDEIRQLLGDGGAGKGNRGSQLFGRGDGHDTGADGEVLPVLRALSRNS